MVMYVYSVNIFMYLIIFNFECLKNLLRLIGIFVMDNMFSVESYRKCFKKVKKNLIKLWKNGNINKLLFLWIDIVYFNIYDVLVKWWDVLVSWVG